MLEAVGHSPTHGDLSDSRLSCATTCVISPVPVVCESTASLESSVYSRNWHTTTDVGSKLSGTVPAGGKGSDNDSGGCTGTGIAAASTSGAKHVARSTTTPNGNATGSRRSSRIRKVITPPTARTTTETIVMSPTRDRRIPNTMPTNYWTLDTFKPDLQDVDFHRPRWLECPDHRVVRPALVPMIGVEHSAFFSRAGSCAASTVGAIVRQTDTPTSSRISIRPVRRWNPLPRAATSSWTEVTRPPPQSVTDSTNIQS